MNEDIIFSEKQKFRQWWLWLIFLVINALLLAGVFKRFSDVRYPDDYTTSTTSLLISTAILVFITVLFFILRLETQINSEGIKVRFYPFNLSFRFYPWENITKAYVRNYSPIMEYGGWGIRFGLMRKGRAMNVSGNQGLQLEFNNAKRLLIGTRKPEELKQVVTRFGKGEE